MDITIRSEAIKDYNSIAELNLISFREEGQDWVKEMNIPGTLRHRHGFDPDLALVAEVDGKIVGYALFSPFDVYFKNHLVKSVFLSPLGVLPEYQSKGIGGRLMAEGHRRAMEKGYSLAALFGDREYYQRFGYKAHMLSLNGMTITKEDMPTLPTGAVERPVKSRDIDRLMDLWHQWHKHEPIAMFPGPTLMDWISPDQAFKSSTITVDDQVVGYIRYYRENPSRYTAFLTDNAEHTSQVLAYLKTKFSDTEIEKIFLPINPQSPWVQGLINCPFTQKVNMSQYALLKLLDENPHSSEYFQFIEESEDNIGVVSLPAQFD